MNRFLKRYWNFRILGIPITFVIILKVSIIRFYEKISSFFWKYNLNECGTNVRFQQGVCIRYPQNIRIKDNVAIGRNCNFESEFAESFLLIKKNTQINKNCKIDFSGNIEIGENVLISEEVTIMSHDHGYNPHSKPQKISKIIEDNVWIGSNSIILPKVELIGKNSIIAAGSVVTKNVSANSIVAGNPARLLSGIK